MIEQELARLRFRHVRSRLLASAGASRGIPLGNPKPQGQRVPRPCFTRAAAKWTMGYWAARAEL
jgi:hypothetical protein